VGAKAGRRSGSLRKRKLIQPEAKRKRCHGGSFLAFFASLKGGFEHRNKAIGILPMFLVVSEFLTRTPGIFVEFERIPRKSGFCILNDFQRLPLVLALFSPN
jgi:hypothetical protein